MYNKKYKIPKMIILATHNNHKIYYINSNTLKNNNKSIDRNIYMNTTSMCNLANIGYVITWEEHPE